MYLVVYSFFIYLEDEGCEWMMVVVCEVREIILKIKKIWHFNEIKCKIDNLMWMFWKVYVQTKFKKDESLYFLSLKSTYKYLLKKSTFKHHLYYILKIVILWATKGAKKAMNGKIGDDKRVMCKTPRFTIMQAPRAYKAWVGGLLRRCGTIPPLCNKTLRAWLPKEDKSAWCGTKV